MIRTTCQPATKRSNSRSLVAAVRQALEPLERRAYLAIVATFFPQEGILSVTGDALDNAIVVSRTAGGNILVNDGAVVIGGGIPTVGSTGLITVSADDGNDRVELNQTNGPLPAAELHGGPGNDTLIGGAGADVLFGGAGDDLLEPRNDNDSVFGADGNDVLVWNAGDESDLFRGGNGADALQFNGNNVNETVDVAANGIGLTVTRDVANIIMDLDEVEHVNVSAGGGTDVVVIHDLSSTHVTQVAVNLEGTAGAGNVDGQADHVVIEGTAAPDSLAVSGGGSSVSVAASVAISVLNGEAQRDVLVIRGHEGSDLIDASALGPGALDLTLDGAAGNDTIHGSAGIDTITGGIGRDDISGGPGSDFVSLGEENDTFTWNAGDGVDSLFGDAGNDRLIVNGTAENETITASGVNARVRIERSAGGVSAFSASSMDQVELNGGGGDDMLIGELTLPELATLVLNGGDGNDSLFGTDASDAIVGGPGDDFIDADRGDDEVAMGDGNDTFIWKHAYGRDEIDGAAGVDTVKVVGTVIDESYDIAPSDQRLAVSLLGTGVVLSAGAVEVVALHPLGGADTIAIRDVAAVGVSQVNIDLAQFNGGVDGDFEIDTIVLHGTAGADAIHVSGDPGAGIDVAGLPAAVNLLRSEPDRDVLRLVPLAGADTVTIEHLFNLHNTRVAVDLATSSGGANPDGAADEIHIAGTDSPNVISVTDTPQGTEASGFSAKLTIERADALFDALHIHAGGGNDTISINQGGATQQLRRVNIAAGAGTDTIDVIETATTGIVTIEPGAAGEDIVRVNADAAGSALAQFNETQRIGSLTIGAGGRVRTVSSGVVLTTGALAITGTGRLDLGRNSMIVDYTGDSPVQSIRSMLVGGYAGGAWNGPGINSSIAAVVPGTAIGFAEATDLFGTFPATFKGQTIDASAVLLTYTLVGDATLDGRVNLEDFNRLAANFGQGGRRWNHGDFDFDGTVNLNDFNRLAAKFGQVATAPAAAGMSEVDDVLDGLKA